MVQEKKAAEQMNQQLEEAQARETEQYDQMRVLTEKMNSMQQQFLQQQQQMMANFTAFSTAGGTPVPARHTTTNDSDQNKSKDKYTKKYNAKAYCWTHGVGHHGNECLNPSSVHKPKATVKNTMGGSAKGCHWL